MSSSVLEVFLDLAHPAPPGGAAETARRPGGVLTAAAAIELVVREAREDDRTWLVRFRMRVPPAPGPRAPPLHRRSFICVRADDEQLVLRQALVVLSLLRVGDRGIEQLQPPR